MVCYTLRPSKTERMQANTISKHLDHIYESGELTREATISILETVQIEGNREVKRNIEYLYKFSMGSPKDFETLLLERVALRRCGAA